MKNLYLMGAIVLLSTTLFSCTADDYDTAKTNEKPAIPAYADGPGDQPITVPPPPPPKK
ncbi:hypothetical protein ACHRVW_11405 [Flavobacterium collinsii]|uniref:hypothetical protein n=2 Tax=Flavobacterium collinsii TaxID=1114861 RepID=UPI0022CA676A|nr:hypothetical protein Flavo103_02400 [Flavobacterium collinsii]